MAPPAYGWAYIVALWGSRIIYGQEEIKGMWSGHNSPRWQSTLATGHWREERHKLAR